MKYVSGRLRKLELGLSSYSENKPTLNVIGNSTFNGQIVGAATSNVIPFLYSNFSDLPSAVTYHGAFAHVHGTGKAYYAHAANWYELVNKELNGTVGTGTEKYNIGHIDSTSLNVSGIASASAFADFDYLQAPYGSTVNFTVTVASKSNHRYSGGSSNAYYINGVESPVLTLTPGRTYRFNNNNSGSHPLRFYYDANKTIQYTAGVNFQNTYTDITVSDTTPNVLHYQCGNHALMGNSVVTNSNVVDSPYAATLRDSLTVSGDLNANGNILGDNSTNISGINSVTATSFFGDGSGLVNLGIPGISTSGTTELTNLELSGNLKVAGVSTFGNDKVIVGGATTDLLVNGSARVTGELKVGDGTITLNSAGLSTFPTGVDVSGGSGLIASSAKITDLTPGRVVFAGTGGELEDSANLTFDGTTLIGAFSGDGSGLTGVSIPGISTSGTSEFANLDLSGNLKVAGVSTFEGNINANGNIVGDSATNISGINNVSASTLTGTLQTAAQPNITSLGTLSAVTVSGNINANGNIVGDSATNITGIAGVTASTLTGTLQTAAQPNITSFGTLTGLDVNGHTELDDVNVSGASTFATAKVTDLTDNRIVIAGTGGELEDTSKLTFDGTTLSIVGNATFTGNVSVAGTLTSEDKTNVDSIGIVTARTGVRISSGGLVVNSGVATFTDAIDSNGGANISGGAGLVASTAKVSDLTDGRVVYAGASGELQDSSNLTFNGTTLNGTFSGDGTALLVTIPGISTNTTSEFTNLSVVGVLTAGSAVLGSARVTDLTQGRIVFVGNSGELQDNGTLTFNGSTVTAPAFAGDGSALTGITAGGVGAIGGLTVKDEGVVVGTAGSISTLDFLGGTVSVIANTGAAGIASVTISTEQNQNIQNINVSGLSTFGGNISANGDIVGDNSTNISGINSVTATSFFGDGSGLQNTGATLSAASGSQRLVLTSLTSGTMTTAATDADLSFNATENLLTAGRLSITGITTFNDDVTFKGATSGRNITFDQTNNRMIFDDFAALFFGTNTDMQILHSGGGATIQNYTGDTHFYGPATKQFNFNRKVFVGEDLEVDGVAELDDVNVAGVATVTGNVKTTTGYFSANDDIYLISSGGGSYTQLNTNSKDILIDARGNSNKIMFRTASGGNNPSTTTGWDIEDDGDFVPTANKTVDIGSSSKYVDKAYLADVYTENIVITSNIMRTSTGGDIGSSSYKFNNVYATAFHGDGSNLTGISGGGGGDKFNTTITNSVQASVHGYETDIITFPSDSTKRYVIESISLGNVTAGAGQTVNVIASINPGVTTYSSEYKVYLAYNAEVPDAGLIELIKEPMVMNPSDVLKVWATDSTNTGINGALELYATYTEHESTDYIAGYGSTTNITTTALATIYTSTSYPTIIQSIKATNRTDTGDFPVTIQIVNGSTITHLAKDLVIPKYASVELLDRPKRIEAGATIRMQQSAAANTVDVIVSGKKITS